MYIVQTWKIYKFWSDYRGVRSIVYVQQPEKLCGFRKSTDCFYDYNYVWWGLNPCCKDNEVHEERTNVILRTITRPSNDVTVQQYTCIKCFKQTMSIVRFECVDEYFRNSEKIFLLKIDVGLAKFFQARFCVRRSIIVQSVS